MSFEADQIQYLSEADGRSESSVRAPWAVLIVDDDVEVHELTQIVLADFSFQDRPLRFISAYSAGEALEILKRAPTIAVCLLDVVLENETAGLSLVRTIREDLGNVAIRIVLRTGQPGVAPERDVLSRYDINDYKGKTELTQGKLIACMISALRSYQQVVELERHRRRLSELNRTLEMRVQERTRALQKSERRLQSILDAAVYPIVISRLGDGLVRYCNRRAEELFGAGATSTARAPGFFVRPSEADMLQHSAREQGRLDDVEVALVRGDGVPFWALMSCTVMDFENEPCLLSSFNDISHRKQLELELTRLATTDALTGIHNRRRFLELTEQDMHRAIRFGRPLSLAIFDLDHFKKVNDLHGHPAGDRVLCTVTGAVQGVLRATDHFGRLGGEEFGILLPETSASGAAVMGERVRAAVARASHGVEGLGAVTISLGVAELASPQMSLNDLLARADAALYAAKEGGRNRVVVAGRDGED